MTLLDGSKGGQSGSQLDDLEALVQVADLHPEPATFERWLRGILGRPAAATQGGVTLSTVHRVKGMEWDRVVVAGVTEGVLPHRLAEDEEEERRILHVAITRCRHRVVVLADATPAFTVPRRARRFRAEARGPPPRDAEGSDAHPEVEVGEVRAAAGARARRRARRGGVARVATRTVPGRRRPRLHRGVERGHPCDHDRTADERVELAKIDGIGPTKLDLYGDEILAVLDAVTD